MLTGRKEAYGGRKATLYFARKENETQRTDVIYSSPTFLKGEHDIDNPASIHFLHSYLVILQITYYMLT